MITRRAVMLGAAAVAAAIVMPTAAKGLSMAGPTHPFPAGWIHCDWRIEISSEEFPDLYRVLIDATYPRGYALWGELPERIPLPRIQYYDPWDCYWSMFIIKARYSPDDGLSVHLPVGHIVGWVPRP